MGTAYVQTPLGTAILEGDEMGLGKIGILDASLPPGMVPGPLEDAVYQLQEYFQGKRQTFDLTLNPQGTDFQMRVWEALREIPYGRTWSYLELAKRLGEAKAVRAVAAANGKNPLWVVVPCHRVIGSNGDLIGYAGGLARKKWLLDHECPPVQTTLF